MTATLAIIASLVGQSDIVLTAPSCKTCRIEKAVVVEIGKDPSAQDAAPNGLMGAIQVRNTFLGVPMDGPPIVFGIGGKVIRVLGRRGGGPGEFTGPGPVSLGRGDSVLISDPQAGRISVFDSSWRFVRTILMGGGYEAWAPLDDGRIVVGRNAGHDPSVVETMFVLDAKGKRLSAFGRPTAADSAAGRLGGTPLLATDGKLIWSVSWRSPYRISEWEPSTGRRLRTLVRRGPEFLDKLTGKETSPTQHPEPFVNGFLRVGPLLWVLYAVPDREWAKGLKQVESRGHGETVKSWTAEYPDQVFDTIVEAIDIATGQVLASRRFDEHLIAFVSTGTLALHRSETAEGEPISRVVRFELKR